MVLMKTKFRIFEVIFYFLMCLANFLANLLLFLMMVEITIEIEHLMFYFTDIFLRK